MSDPRPLRVLSCEYDNDNNVIIMSVIFTDNNMHRKFCLPAADLIKAFNIKGNVEPHHWIKFCKDLIGKNIKMVCEMVGDPESPAATWDEMIDIHEKSVDKYFS